MSVNYKYLKPKCPKCQSSNIKFTNKYRRKLVIFRGVYTPSKEKVYICKDCNHEFTRISKRSRLL